MAYTKSEIDALDLNQYKGQNYYLYDENGNLIEHSDTRVIQYEIKKKLDKFRKFSNDEILSAVPIHTQLNMAMGAEPALEITNNEALITSIRAKFNQKKVLLLNSSTPEEVDAIKWND